MTYKRTVIIAIVFIAGIGFNQVFSRAEAIHANRSFSEFPMEIGPWKGQEERFDQQVYDVLGVDDSVLANYRDGANRLAQLYIGFYQSQREGDIIHSPRNCMPGSGWNIADIAYDTVQNARDESGRSKVIKMTLVKGSEKQIVLYWFQSRGRIIHSEYWQKIYLVIDSITKNRTDGSFVRLIAPAVDGDEQKAVDTLKNFARVLMPILYEFIPS